MESGMTQWMVSSAWRQFCRHASCIQIHKMPLEQAGRQLETFCGQSVHSALHTTKYNCRVPSSLPESILKGCQLWSWYKSRVHCVTALLILCAISLPVRKVTC